MDFNLIKTKIEKYDKIIIFRHKRPDFDAIGSQIGLKEAILATYPNKTVYAVGDSNRFDKYDEMDNLEDKDFKDALAIIVDVAVKNLISDDRYSLCKEVIVIDHHQNPCDIEGAYAYIDSSYEAAAAYIYNILEKLGFKISPRSADMLLSGIITDSGRFQYLKDAERLFLIASKLAKLGAKPTELYSWLYTESLEDRLRKIDLQSRMQIEDGVAFLYIDQELLDKYPEIDVFSMSRGTVNLMAGIEGVPIWANFTYDKDQDLILGEFRSRGIVIADIAKKYGGGGHDNACGARLKDWDEVKLIINDFKKLIK